MDIPEELGYTKEHEWLRDESGIVTIGVTDYAQAKLGDVVFVEMPELSISFKKGDSFAVIESVKAASDIFAPVSGEVIEINRDLEDHPEYVNQSPYGEGWIVKFRITDASELDDLMHSSAYQEYVRQEESRL